MLANVVSGLVWRGGGAVSSSGLRRGMWLLGYIGAGYTVRAGIWLSVNSHCPDCPDATLAEVHNRLLEKLCTLHRTINHHWPTR